MFEFHGWANVRVSEEDNSDFTTIGRGPKADAMKRVRAAINECHDDFSSFDVLRAGNGLMVLSVHGLRNHRFEPVIELFRHIANEFPEAYGLLYIRDDEDTNRDGEFDNVFRVWKVALGKIQEVNDTLLSPCIPTVELS